MMHLAPRAAAFAFAVAATPLRPRLLASAANSCRPVGSPRSLSLRTSLFGAPPAAVTLAGRRRVSGSSVQGAREGTRTGVPGGNPTPGNTPQARPLPAVAATSAGGEMDSDDEMHQARSAGGAGVYLNSGPLRSGVGGRGGRGMSSVMSAATTAAAPPVEEGGAYAGQIFCNRNLNMAKISAVGFDMDYTLSQYNSEVFEMLSFQGALNNLVTRLGYPEALLERKDSYDHHFFIRGLVVDKVRGNIIKMDRHKYVKVALHGFRVLSKAERETVYDPTESAWNSFAEPNYAVLDTIFSIPDAYLFALLIDYKDAHPGEISQSNLQIYADVRRSVDLCHRDGWIKEQVAADPARFIHVDPNLVPMLERLRRSGRKMFLLTNSLWDYTEVVMTFLYNASEAGRNGGDWKDLFDVIICGSCKPGFLIDKRLSLYRVDVASGQLVNTEGIIYETADEYLAGGKVFQGGNWTHLHQLLNVKTGSQLLYVGDHMYSDILRSKRQLGWRTMLVIPELAHEINVLASTTTQLARIDSLRHQQDELDDMFECLRGELDRQDNLKTLAAAGSSVDNGDSGAGDAGAPAWNRSDAVQELERLRSELTTVKAAIAKETEAYHEAFHPVWGQLFKTGLQNSTFAKQVESYACLYTASASNLLQPNRYWRCWPDHLPHDWKFGRQETPAERRLPKASEERGAAPGADS